MRIVSSYAAELVCTQEKNTTTTESWYDILGYVLYWASADDSVSLSFIFNKYLHFTFDDSHGGLMKNQHTHNTEREKQFHTYSIEICFLRFLFFFFSFCAPLLAYLMFTLDPGWFCHCVCVCVRASIDVYAWQCVVVVLSLSKIPRVDYTALTSVSRDVPKSRH